jgi:hypothetical protein
MSVIEPLIYKVISSLFQDCKAGVSLLSWQSLDQFSSLDLQRFALDLFSGSALKPMRIHNTARNNANFVQLYNLSKETTR